MTARVMTLALVMALVFLLHIAPGADNTNNVLVLAFGVLIAIPVAAGSLWIITKLNEKMTPAPEPTNVPMQC